MKIVATGFGSGFTPFAPGTAGTVIGIPVYLVFSHFSWPLYLISVVAFSFLAVYVSREAEKIFNKKDAQCIVIDEIVGFQFTMFLITPTVLHIFIGFLLFRFFDIIKLFPAGLCERKVSGGYGVVGDDVIAGIYANISLLLLIKHLGV
ncbi:MAG: phosphatidylglycerophosphatase A [Planctomycetaceae bacterium]|nr:MAG: phosphatidylglycerophosphatase A [Planctomycetaceae bacterium]